MSETSFVPETEPAGGVSQSVTVSLLSGRSVQVPATASTALGTIRVEAARLLGVCVAKLVHADGSSLDEQQTLTDAGLDLGQPLQALVRTTIEVGDLVKVQDGVTPVYGWGGVKPDECGKVVSIDGDDVTVNFASYLSWSGKLREIEMVEATEPLRAPLSTIDVGHLVKVREGVTPSYGWGNVKPGDGGKVVSISGNSVTVNFAGQSGWTGRLDEMEVVHEPEVTVKVALLSGRSVEVSATASTLLYEIRAKASGIFGVRLSKLVLADGSSFDEQQSLADAGIDLQEPLQALVGDCDVEVGSMVRIRDDVVAPMHGWGSVSRGDRGRVTAVCGDNATVDFPSQNGWSGKLDELEPC